MKRGLKLLGCFLVCAIMLSGIAFATANENDVEYLCVYSCETGESQIIRADDFIAQNKRRYGKTMQNDSSDMSYPAIPPENGPAWAKQNPIAPQYVYGEDTKWTECNPYIWGVASITAIFEDGHREEGTAFVFAYNALATAAHVVYNSDHGKQCKEIEISCSRNGNSYPYGTIKSSYVITSESYQAGYMGTNNDYAIIVTEEEIGKETGIFGFKNKGAYYGQQVESVAYPHFLDNGKNVLGNYKQYHDAGKITKVTPDGKIVTHRLDTSVGSSGGPLFASEYRVVGIISSEAPSEGNKATGIVDTLYALMSSYR